MIFPRKLVIFEMENDYFPRGNGDFKMESDDLAQI